MFAQRLKGLTPYVPGEQPRDQVYIKLNTNENPYPPPPVFSEFLARFDLENLRRYPDPQAWDLRRALAQKHKLKTEQVFVGNGSDEVLALAFYAFFDARQGKLILPEFTYSFYPVYCHWLGLDYHKISLLADFSLDTSVYANHPACCGAVLCNPNAPTGLALNLDQVSRLIAAFPSNRLFLIDEAYIDFGAQSAIPLLARHDNLLITRTFSKSHALAGLRLGYALGSSSLIKALFTVKDSFNSYPVDALAQGLGCLAIQNDAWFKEKNHRIACLRDVVGERLRAMGWRVIPSKANFFLAARPGFSGRQIYQIFKESGILVRHFPADGLKEYARITVGTDKQMEALEQVARQKLSDPSGR